MAQAVQAAQGSCSDAFDKSPQEDREFIFGVCVLAMIGFSQFFIWSNLGSSGWGVALSILIMETGLAAIFIGYLMQTEKDRNTAFDQCLQLATEIGIELNVEEVVELAKAGSSGQTYLHFVNITLAEVVPVTKNMFFVGNNCEDQAGSQRFVEHLHKNPSYYADEMKLGVTEGSTPEQTAGSGES